VGQKDLTNRSSQPLAGALLRDHMTTDHRLRTKLALASGGSAPSR